MEEPKKEISEKLLRYLKRRFFLEKSDISSSGLDVNFISVNGKLYFLKNNKKFLVNKIVSIVESDWESLETPIMRRTIKKFIDSLSIQ